MRMWAFCQQDSKRERAMQGFSLLELLVVLALMSAVTALVVPRLATTVDAIQRSGERAEAVRQLERLPLLVRRTGTELRVERNQRLAVEGMELPQGWTLQTLERLQVAGNGYCHPSLLEVLTPAGVERWTLAAPDCRVADAP